MNAGALHTIITDGVWYPERANKRRKNDDGLCLLCIHGKKGGLQHIRWEREACNSVTNYNWLQLQEIKKQMKSESQCLWTTGVIAKECTALPETDYMRAEDTRLDSMEKADKVYIDGSATKIGASAYAGWG
eukprot:13060352-Heterocapsa_arctica.AAC.1